jgi:hypothetical protein
MTVARLGDSRVIVERWMFSGVNFPQQGKKKIGRDQPEQQNGD